MTIPFSPCPRWFKPVSKTDHFWQAKYDAFRHTKPVVRAIRTPALLNEMKALHAKLLDAKIDVEFEIRRRAPQEHVLRSLSQDDADLAIKVVGFRYQAVLNHCRFGKDSLVVFYDPEVREPISTVQEYVDGRHGVASIGTQSKCAVARTLSELGVKRKVSLIAPTASMLGGLIMGTDMVATLPRRLMQG